jgi:hypothetical protein
MKKNKKKRQNKSASYKLTK